MSNKATSLGSYELEWESLGQEGGIFFAWGPHSVTRGCQERKQPLQYIIEDKYPPSSQRTLTAWEPH